MRIGVNTLFYRPTEVGGSETYLLELLHWMMQATQGHEWVFFTNLENHDVLLKRFGGERRVSFVPLRFRAGNRLSRMFWEQIVLPIKVPAQRLDLLWSPGYVLPVLVRRPQVLTVFDMQTRSFPDDFHAVATWAMNVLVSLGCRLSSRILTTSQFSKMEIIRFTRIPERRITVTPLATTEVFAEGTLDAVRARLARDLPVLKYPYLLCVSFSHPHKNLAWLAEVFVKLSREIPHQLVLVGRPGRGERALQEALERQTPGRVLRLPYVSQETLVALYRAADLFIMPSLYEGF
ncbi:MAG: glycosyltransferase family 1 protein, partial [Candidatus Omnitrophica bacterium]|nr:glycosyltransferase family 1 protein [Candidatus Omnitrophota bacterium]